MRDLGERTRNPDSAHINFFQGVENPLGVKIGTFVSEESTLKLLNCLNPLNLKGRLVVICRLGLKNVELFLPKLIEVKQKHKLNFLWSCDPMHGNTESQGGIKTRNYESILKVIEGNKLKI